MTQLTQLDPSKFGNSAHLRSVVVAKATKSTAFQYKRLTLRFYWAHLGCVSPAVQSPELIVAGLDNAHVYTGFWVSVVSFFSAPRRISVVSIFAGSRPQPRQTAQSRPSQANQEVRQQIGIVHRFNFQNKTCANLGSTSHESQEY